MARLRVLFVVLLLTLTVLPAGRSVAHHDTVQGRYAVFLDGAQEEPGPGDPDGEGTAIVSLNPATGQLCMDLGTNGIAPATGLHVHRGGPGQVGDVQIELQPILEGKKCVRGLSATLLREMRLQSNRFYVDLHNAAFPDGAIRGQLAATARQTYPVESGRANLRSVLELLSTIVVQEPPGNRVVDVNVLVRIAYPRDDELSFVLESPDGTRVQLAEHNGGTGADFGTGGPGCASTHTVFDNAGTPISQGSAPFVGMYHPVGSLSEIMGEVAAGAWSLHVFLPGRNVEAWLECWQVDITRA